MSETIVLVDLIEPNGKTRVVQKQEAINMYKAAYRESIRLLAEAVDVANVHAQAAKDLKHSLSILGVDVE